MRYSNNYYYFIKACRGREILEFVLIYMLQKILETIVPLFTDMFTHPTRGPPPTVPSPPRSNSAQ